MKWLDAWKRHVLAFRTGLALALFFLWLSLSFPVIAPELSELPLSRATQTLTLVLIVLSGFVFALLFDRFLPRARRNLLHLFSVLLLLSLTLFSSFVRLPFAVCLVAALLAAALLGMLCLPLIRPVTSASTALIIFGTAAVVLLLAVRPAFALSGLLHSLWFHVRFVAFSCVLLAAAVLLAGRPADENTRTPEEAASGSLPGRRGVFPVVCGGLILSLFTCGACILSLFDDARPLTTPPPLLCLSLAAVVMAVLCRVAVGLADPTPLLAYCAVSGFSLGLLTAHLLPSNSWVTLLPLFCFAVAGAALSLALIHFCCRLVSSINRVFALFLCFSCILAIIIFIAPGMAPSGAPASDDVNPALMVGLVLAVLFTPALFFVRRDERASSQVPAAAPDETAAPPPAAAPPDLYPQLTTAEKRVYDLVVRGYANQQVADMLYISINTVKFHVKNILAKAGVSKKSHLVLSAAADSFPLKEASPEI